MLRISMLNPSEILKTGRSNIRLSRNAFSNGVKRIFDFVIALTGLILLAPVFGLIAIMLKRDSPGPVFYWGSRMGRNGRVFKILKFRTMFEHQQCFDGPRVTCKMDDRITPFGRWLRDTKVNELPQLWNVLIGDMSLVGPRPEDPEIVKNWPEDARREALSVRPGITSPASILYHDEENMLSIANVMGEYLKVILPDKMRLDRLYVSNRSFASDLDIIFWTMTIFLPGIAKRRIPEGYLFAGPFSRLIKRHFSWFLVDSVISICAVGVAVLLWHNQAPLSWGAYPLVMLAIVIALLFSCINAVSGLNQIIWSEAFTEDAAGLVVSSGFVTFLALLMNYFQSRFHFLPYPSLPMDMIFTIGLMASAGFLALRYRLRLFSGLAGGWLSWRRNKVRIGEQVLIVGSGEGNQIASWLLRHGETSRLLSIVGIVDDEQPARHGMRVKGNLLLGGTGDLPALIKRFNIGVVLLAVPRVSIEKKTWISNICNKHNSRLVLLTDLLDVLNQQWRTVPVMEK
jgi:lipopolysaccharide/colanic/teichoic acid biosynthesis glycosyltransferase